MDLKHLQALVGIADYGSFSAAADALGTVQSNVSAHVARLERELDAMLVDRASGRLTPEGQVVVARARRMVSELDAMVADVVAMQREVVGTVRLGTIGTTGRWVVPPLFAVLRARHPRIRMAVTDGGSSATLENELLAGQLDLAVVTLPLREGELSAFPLFEEDLVLVLSADHPLLDEVAPNEPLSIAALGELELLMPMAGTALRDDIDAAVAPSGVTLRPAIELDGIRLIASLTFDGHGPAILPATAVPVHLRSQFRLVPLEGFPRRQVGVALRRRGLPSAPMRAVIEVLRDVVDDADQVREGLHPSTETTSA